MRACVCVEIICCAKGDATVDHSIVPRWFKGVSLWCNG